MQAIQVQDWSQGPKTTTIDKPPPPPKDYVQVKVVASGLHQLVKSRAAGKHYTAGAGLPHTPGVDGVGTLIDGGKRVYFHILGDATATGTFQEVINVREECIVEIPKELDSVMVAGLINPVMSSWMALKYRVPADVREKGWTCLIMGATSASGKLAIEIARALGASKVYGAARDQAAMSKLPLDVAVTLKEKPEETDFGAAKDATVVLDYLFGPWPHVFLNQAKGPVCWVGIGNMAGADGYIPGPVLRMRDVTIRGSGPGSWSVSDHMNGELDGMVKVLTRVSKDLAEVKGVRAEEANAVWGDKGRYVILFGEGR